jgi:hypothetical protein
VGGLKPETIEAPTKGLDTDTAPHALAAGYAQEHLNLLCHVPGEVRIRGGIGPSVSGGADPFAGVFIATGAWTFGNKILLGKFDFDGVATREPWHAAHHPASAANRLAVAEDSTNDLALIDLDADTVTAQTPVASGVPGGKGVRLGNYVYGWNYDSGTREVPGGFAQTRDLLRWDGSNAPELLGAAPRHGMDVTAHLNRLWALAADGATIGDLSVSQPRMWDEFDGYEGDTNITGNVSPSGDTWSNANSFATNFTGLAAYGASTAAIARAATGDSNALSGAHLQLGSSARAASRVSTVVSLVGDATLTNGAIRMGVYARYVDANNWVMLCADLNQDTGTQIMWTTRVLKRVSGTGTILATGPSFVVDYGEVLDLRLSLDIDVAGVLNWLVEPVTWVVDTTPSLPASQSGTLTDAVLATSGALDDGQVGIYHANSSGVYPLYGLRFMNFSEGVAITTAGSGLYYTTQYGPLRGDQYDWRDPATGLVNKIVVGSDDDDTAVALARAGEVLVVFKRDSTYVLSGFSPDTFQLKCLSRDVGCLDALSIVETERAVFWLAEQGYMYYDGSTLANMSENLTSSLGSTASLNVGNIAQITGNDCGRAVASALPNDYILLTVHSRDALDGSASGRDTFCGLLHTPTGAWTRFSSAVLDDDIPYYVGETASYNWCLDGRYLWLTGFVTRPDEVAEGARGVDAERNFALTAIDAQWHSRILSLAHPDENVQMHRFGLDYEWRQTSTDENDAWQVTLYKPDVTAPLGDPGVATSTLNTVIRTRLRAVWDTYGEANQLSALVESQGDGTDPADGRVHEVFIEYQPTRQRRGTL